MTQQEIKEQFKQQALKLKQEGKTYEEIAKELGYSSRQIFRFIKEIKDANR